MAHELTLRPISDLDIEAVAAIDEKITGVYRPGEWDERFGYYLRRDPECSLVAELDGNVVGFMLGEVRAGEFGLEEPAGWLEVIGVDPEVRGKGIGRRLLTGMLDGFRQRGARYVRTLVDEASQAPLLGFFAAAGFDNTTMRTLQQSL